ncbi:MAG TPA: hypothetical protein VK960_04225 [Acidimicrobiia bacterium]|nr:hypothetical protein [Acidimicrobiia bacterium]
MSIGGVREEGVADGFGIVGLDNHVARKATALHRSSSQACGTLPAIARTETSGAGS